MSAKFTPAHLGDWARADPLTLAGQLRANNTRLLLHVDILKSALQPHALTFGIELSISTALFGKLAQGTKTSRIISFPWRAKFEGLLTLCFGATIGTLK